MKKHLEKSLRLAEEHFNKNPFCVRSIDLNQFRKLIKEIDKFIGGFEEHQCIDDSVEINFYSNGDILVNGEFSSRVDQKIVI